MQAHILRARMIHYSVKHYKFASDLYTVRRGLGASVIQ